MYNDVYFLLLLDANLPPSAMALQLTSMMSVKHPKVCNVNGNVMRVILIYKADSVCVCVVCVMVWMDDGFYFRLTLSLQL